MSHMSPEVTVPEEWIAEVADVERAYCQDVRHVDPRDAVIHMTKSSGHNFRVVEPYLSNYSHPKILEIGSGYGFGLCDLLGRGLDAIGVEPGSTLAFENRFAKALKLLESNGIKPAGDRLLRSTAENLPSQDNVFDIVHSITVLEHVNDVERCMNEALRVTKPGGVIIMVVPNYNSFHEGHYNIFWLPYALASKKMAKWYVRTIFRRADYYVDELNFTTPRIFRKLATRLSDCKTLNIELTIQRPFGRIDAIARILWPNGRALRNMVSNLLMKCGLAPGFNVEIYKKSGSDAESRTE